MKNWTVHNQGLLGANMTGGSLLQNYLQQSRGMADAKEVQDKVDKYRKGDFDTISDPSNLEHFKTQRDQQKQPKEGIKQDGPFAAPSGDYTLPHPIWTEEQLHNVKVSHKKPETFVDKMAWAAVKLLRGGFDLFSGFKIGKRTERKWLNRIVFLETVAGVPGMVAAMSRHMGSLRRLQRDHGWIHTLLEEAENERMHLLTALQLRQPSWFFRISVIGAQGIFVNLFFISYAVSARFCHRFVGYLEEEAVITYTKCLEDIENGPMTHWKTQRAPEIAIRYWKLGPEATMKDVILAIRADEAHHRVVNHSLASLKKDEFNPYKPGE